MIACIESSSGHIEYIHGEAFTDDNGRVPNAIAREKGIVPPKYVALFEMNADGLSSYREIPQTCQRQALLKLLIFFSIPAFGTSIISHVLAGFDHTPAYRRM